MTQRGVGGVLGASPHPGIKSSWVGNQYFSWRRSCVLWVPGCPMSIVVCVQVMSLFQTCDGTNVIPAGQPKGVWVGA